MKSPFSWFKWTKSNQAPYEEIDWPAAKSKLLDSAAQAFTPLGLQHQSALEFYSLEPNEFGMRKMLRIHDAGSLRPLTINWGYSFDFVPHLAGSKVGWHRTFKSAKRDFWVVPLNNGPEVSRLHGMKAFEAALPPLLRFGAAEASKFWSEQSHLNKLPDLLIGANSNAGGGKRDARGFFPMTSLFAEAFTFARLQQYTKAERALEQVVLERKLESETRQDLFKKLQSLRQ